MIELTSSITTFLIYTFAVGGCVAPAYGIVNRFIREEPFDWNRTIGVGITLFAAGLFAGMITVNGIALTAQTLFSVITPLAFISAFALTLLLMTILGALLAHPLHRFIQWQESPEIIEEYRP